MSEETSKVDLHIHTTFSNGKDSLISVLEHAEKNKIKVISITDYNTLKSYIKLKNEIDVSKYFSGEIVVGLEVRCKFKDSEGMPICCDMLAYNMDLECVEEMQKWLENNTGKDQTIQGQIEQLNHFKSVAKQMRLRFDEDLSLNMDEQKAGMAMIKNLLKYYDENIKIWPQLEKYKEEPTSAWVEVFSNPKSKFFFDITQYCPAIEDFIEIVHKSNGLVFAAHPFAYVFNQEKDEQQSIQDLIKYAELCLQKGVDGIECFNQYNCSLVNNAIPSSNALLEYCIKNNILISGGTDYHGTDIRHEGIGNLGSDKVQNAATEIPFEVISNWAKPQRINAIKLKAKED